MTQHIWSPSWEKFPGNVCAPWVGLQILQFGIPVYNLRIQTDTIINLWANYSPGFMLMLFVYHVKLECCYAWGLADQDPSSSVHPLSLVRLWDPMDCSTPGLPVHHQLPELAQTHVHRAGDAIQPPHPLSPISPPAFNFFQHQGLFQWVISSHQVAKILEFQLQHLSFQWTFRSDLLQDRLVGSPCSPRDSQESSPTPQFKSINSLVLSFLYGPALKSIHDYWKNHSFD